MSQKDAHLRGANATVRVKPHSGDGSVMADEKPHRGRPSVEPDQPSTDVHLTISIRLYDLAYAEASKRRVTVPEVIRRALHVQLET